MPENEVSCALEHGSCPAVCPGHTVSETLWKTGAAPGRTAIKMELATGTKEEGERAKILFKGCVYERSQPGRQQAS